MIKKSNSTDLGGLTQFLEKKEDDLIAFDKLDFMKISEKYVGRLGRGTLLVQGNRGSGKSTFLKFLSWQKKQSSKKFICIHYTPWYFDSHSFYESFIDVLKNELLQNKYCSTLSNELDALINALHGETGFWYKMVGSIIGSEGRKSVGSIIQSIANTLNKTYSEYHIMIVIDEIDRLHVDDLIQVGKLLEFIKILDSSTGNVSTVFAWDSSYLEKIMIPGSINQESNRSFTFDQYFQRFRDNSIDLNRETKKPLIEYYTDEILMIRGTKGLKDDESDAIKRMLDTVGYLLALRSVPFTIRAIERIASSLGGKLQGTTDLFNEISNAQAFTFDILFWVIYLEHIYHDSVNLYNEIDSIINIGELLWYRGISPDKERYKSVQGNLKTWIGICIKELTDENKKHRWKFSISFDVIFEYYELINKFIHNTEYYELIINLKKEKYIKKYIVDIIDNESYSDALKGFNKYYKTNNLDYLGINLHKREISISKKVDFIREILNSFQDFQLGFYPIETILDIGRLIKYVFQDRYKNFDESSKFETLKNEFDKIINIITSEENSSFPKIYKIYTTMVFRWWYINANDNRSFIKEYVSQLGKSEDYFAEVLNDLLIKGMKEEKQKLKGTYIHSQIKRYFSPKAYEGDNYKAQYQNQVYWFMRYFVFVGFESEEIFGSHAEFLNHFSVNDKLGMLGLHVGLSDESDGDDTVYIDNETIPIFIALKNSIPEDKFVYHEDIVISKQKKDCFLQEQDFERFKNVILGTNKKT